MLELLDHDGPEFKDHFQCFIGQLSNESIEFKLSLIIDHKVDTEDNLGYIWGIIRKCADVNVREGDS